MGKHAGTILSLLIGGALSLAVFFVLQGWEHESLERSLESDARAHATILEQNIASMLETVSSIKALYAASKTVERQEFSRFAAIELEGRIAIQALEWIPRVKASDRAAFEAAARRDGHGQFAFTARQSQGQMAAAPVRKEHFPVYFVEPLKGNEAALGFDLASNPARLKALEKARDTGEMTTSGRITLVQETKDQYGFLVFQPIYRNDAPANTVAERRRNLLGFSLGVFRIGDIIAATSKKLHKQHIPLDIFLFDRSAPAGRQLLYPKSAGIESRAQLVRALCVDLPTRVASRQWLITLCPAGGATFGHAHRFKEVFKFGNAHWQSWSVLAGGLLISLLLAAYLRLLTLKAEEQKASEERYHDLVENSLEMIQSVDLEGRFKFVNRAWLEVMGYSREELRKLNAFDLIHPESLAHCKSIFQKVLAGESQTDVQATFIAKDGRAIDIEGSVNCQMAGDTVVSTQSTFRDVTELNKVRKDQVKIAEDLTRLIDTANAPIFGTDKQGLITEWNQAAARIMGYQKDEVLNFSLVNEFVADGSKAAVKEVLDKALKGEETANFELPLMTKSGNRIDILLNSTSRRDASGTIVGVFGVGQDITERKQAQMQLIQASKLATLGEMATAMAHELNQPLNVIKMAADSSIERIEDGRFDSEFAHGKFVRISAQIDRAAAIIDHMRIFGRTDDGTARPFAPVDCMTAALELMGEQLRLREIAVETRFPKHCRKVLGHAAQLEQVILNLIGNARDAIEMNEQAPDQRHKITLIVEDTGPEDRIKLIVRDSGGGIPRDALDRIFEPFFTTKETGKGTGLGLSISYGIITEMGGLIEAANDDDGAEITITLPVAAPPDQAAQRT